MPASTLVYAHRGLHDEAPENSLASIELAAAAGFHGVEVDVRRCKSGELVLNHDADLGGLAVDATTLDGLREACPGLATLGDAARLCHRLGLAMDIELKTRGLGVEAAMLALVELGREAFIVTSFLEDALQEVPILVRRRSLGRLLWPDASPLLAMDALSHRVVAGLSPAGLACPPYEAWTRMPRAFVPSRTLVWCPPAGEASYRRLEDAGVRYVVTDHAEHAGLAREA